MQPKYKTLVELAEAFRTGELSKDHYVLVLDNDCSFLRYIGPRPDGIEEGGAAEDEWEDERYEHCKTLFAGNGYSDLEDACTAAGIPCEWV